MGCRDNSNGTYKERYVVLMKEISKIVICKCGNPMRVGQAIHADLSTFNTDFALAKS